MTTRVPEAPVFDYLRLLRPRLRRMPELPTPMLPSVQPPIEGRGTERCYTGVCVRCGRTLISVVGPVKDGTVCHRACTGRR